MVGIQGRGSEVAALRDKVPMVDLKHLLLEGEKLEVSTTPKASEALDRSAVHKNFGSAASDVGGGC